MDMKITLIGIACIATITILANIWERRPKKLGKVFIISPSVVQLFGIITLIMLAVHALTLLKEPSGI